MPRQIICSNCGKPAPYQLYGSQTALAKLMRVKSLCFDCAFWLNYKEHPQQDTAIINGQLYIFHPITEIIWNKTKRKRKGMVFARNMQTGSVVGSMDYRRIATVPENFKPSFPDQYRFISETIYALLINRECKECLAKGCWDRYYCFWYNKDKAEPTRPWNVVPSYHKIGNEQCESFINKETMYNVNIEENANI